jgi:stage V sporulation protein D (sporulation-specific penicillin-binding protein)
MKHDASMGKRTRLLRTILLGLLSCLMVRLGYIEVVQGHTLSKMAEENTVAETTVPAKRGTIYDRNGRVLAYTTTAYTLLAHTSAIPDKQAFANALAPVLHMSSSAIVALLQKGDWMELRPGGYKVGEETLQKVKAMGLMNPDAPSGQEIYAEPTLKRVYPDKSLAAHVLGFVSQDGPDGQEGHGQAGIELEYDSLLAGKPGHATYFKDSNGNPLPYGYHEDVAPVPGKDIYLTIDATIQGFAQRALEEEVQKTKAGGGSVIVADPKTGEILAMASVPEYDPNAYWQADAAVLESNPAITNPFEPGSTFKIVTLTASIANHTVDIDNDTYMSGKINVGGTWLHDWNYTGWGRINFRQATIHSSNVGFVILGQKLGHDRLYQYIDRFGFNAPTGIDLPGEGSSILFPPDDQSQLDLAETSFGQGVAVTPIQQVAAVGAIANGGELMRPYVMKKVVDPVTRQIIEQQGPHVVRNVAPPSVMQKVNSVLKDDVASEPSPGGLVPGYTVAGKTGTASIPLPDRPGYYQDRYKTSFISYAPADNPALEIYVTVDAPRNDLQFGNIVAAPVAMEIYREALPYLRVSPDQPMPSLPQANANVVEAMTVPDLAGLTRNAAAQAAGADHLQIEFLGDGDKVVDQWPRAGETVPKWSVLRALLKRGDGGVETQVGMPDLLGLSMRDAVDILSLLGLNVNPVGDGFVVAQSVPPGQMVNIGQTVTVRLAPKD